jgi:outer membrane protein assembly factor BamD
MLTRACFQPFSRSRAVVLLLAALVLGTAAGCGSSARLQHNSAEEAFNKGMTAFEEGDHQKAQRYFRAVRQYSRGNQWADDAQYFLAASYREQGKYLLAANEFKRFSQIYRTSQRVPQAEFQRANAYYRLSPHYKLDQSDTRQAISLFQLFIERNPDHELVPEAQQKIEELRAKLAHKKYAAARLYEKREMWEAAANTFEGVFDEYPETPWADDALLGAVRTYIAYADRSVERKQDDRLQKAIDHYNRLAQVFPESSLLSRAEDLYGEAQRKLEQVRRQQDESSLASDNGSDDVAG